MKLKTNPFIFLFLASVFTSYSQRCKTEQVIAESIAQDSSILTKIKEIKRFTDSFVADYPNHNASRAVVKLPIVVHVLYKNNQENISLAQINSQITVLNEDYRKLNSNFSSTPAPFQSIAADAEIQFCLASIDPNGNSTTGVTRTQTTVDDIGNTNKYYTTSQGGKDSWDVTKYINIWICDMGNTGVLGFAYKPGTAFPVRKDGIVIGYKYFGTMGAVSSSSSANLGRTATHEIGHYLNLDHLWGPSSGGCGQDDGVSDTPDQDQSTFGCPSFPKTDGCTSSGNGINFNNYMDYVNDNCMTMFTNGQKAVMQATLTGSRALLKNNGGAACPSFAGITDKPDIENNISIYPNPANSFLTVELNSSASFKLMDLTGKEIKSFSVNKSKQIDVSSFSPGVYFITSPDFPSYSQKVVITN